MFNALTKKLGGWVSLSESERNAIATLPAKRLTLARGDDPLAETACTDHAMLVLEGWAAEYKITSTGRRVIVELLLPGDITWLDPTGMNDVSTGTVMLSTGRVLLVPLASIIAMLRYEGIATGLRCAESVRESVQREWLVNIGSRKVGARLAHLLCELSSRMKNVALCTNDACELPLTQSDLADALCVSEVHLNVAIQQLRKSGTVQLACRRLRILDWQRLAKIAEFDDEYLHHHPVRTMYLDIRPWPSPAFSSPEQRVRLFA